MFCAISVAVTKNIMHACIYLLGCLIGVAGLYVTLGADFVAATQFMVYVGGVVILGLFAVMLTGGRTDDSQNKLGVFLSPIMGSKKTYIMGGVTSLVFFLSIFGLLKNIYNITPLAPTNLGEFTPTTEAIGSLLLTDHVLAFELSSILLLGSLVGAAIIARPKVLKIKRKEG